MSYNEGLTPSELRISLKSFPVQLTQRIRVRSDRRRLAGAQPRNADAHALHGIEAYAPAAARHDKLFRFTLQKERQVVRVLQVERLGNQTAELLSVRRGVAAVHLGHNSRQELAMRSRDPSAD